MIKATRMILFLLCSAILPKTEIFAAHAEHVSLALEQESTDVSVSSEGEIPSWLSGTLVRNGPVRVTIGDKTNEHLFDGLAMLHAFSFNDGNVVYSNRFLRTDAYHTVFEEGSLDYVGFASKPSSSIFKRFFNWLFPSSTLPLNNANVNVAKIAEQYVALTEMPLPVKFDLKTLETLGSLQYSDSLPQQNCWESAHPHYDSNRKEMINYLIQFGPTSYYVLYRIEDGSSERKIIAEIPIKKPSYMHSFALTENFIVLTEFPFRANPLDFILYNQPFIKNYYWEPTEGTRFIVIDRSKGEIVKEYITHSFFSFHHVAAFEENDQLIIDIVCYDDTEIIHETARQFKNQTETDLNKDKLEPQRYMRFYLSDSGELQSELIFQNYIEFPKINDSIDGEPFRYAYLTDPRSLESKDDLRFLYKLDTKTKEIISWSQPGCCPGELVFVPHPGGKEEDEGIVMTIVLDLMNHSSFLLLLDAKTFKEVGRVVAPYQIPTGFHAKFFDA